MQKNTIKNLRENAKKSRVKIITTDEELLKPEYKTKFKKEDLVRPEITFVCLDCGKTDTCLPDKLNNNARKNNHGCIDCQLKLNKIKYFKMYQKMVNEYPNDVVMLDMEDDYEGNESYTKFHCNNCNHTWKAQVKTIVMLVKKKTKSGNIRKLCPNCNSKDNLERFKKIIYNDDFYDHLKKTIEKQSFLKNISIKTNKDDLPEGYDGNTEIELYCNKCGNTQVRRMKYVLDSIRAGSYLCKECMRLEKTSSGEYYMMDILDNINLEYLREVNIKIGNSIKYYDFYIPSLNLIIEIDGEQHFKKSIYADYENRESDIIKTKFIINNTNYNLLRIPYLKNNKELRKKIPDIINNIIQGNLVDILNEETILFNDSNNNSLSIDKYFTNNEKLFNENKRLSKFY